MIKMVCHPSGWDPVHRHNAYAFVLVLEGSVVMQLKGEKEVTLMVLRGIVWDGEEGNFFQLFDFAGGPERTRISDLYRVKVAL